MTSHPAPPPLVDVEHLTVRYRGTRRAPGVTALDDVTLRIDRSEAVGIVGESGSGKSTLAKAIAGLTVASSGTLRLDGVDPATLSARERARMVQLVFQDPSTSLNPRRTVGGILAEVVRFHGDGLSRAQVDARVDELLALVELPVGLRSRRPRDLSGGQRQRIGIARALAVDAALLILDESIAALDVSVQAAVLRMLRRLRVDLNLTLLFISHDLAAVRALCERVVVMHRAGIVEAGATDQVLRAPRHEYTRTLLAAEPSLATERPAPRHEA